MTQPHATALAAATLPAPMAALAPACLAPTVRRPTGRIDLILVGARGQVGSALRRQLDRQQPSLLHDAGVDLRLVAAYDRRGFAFDLQGLRASEIESQMLPRTADDEQLLLAHASRPGAARTLLIDCTASEQVADSYLALLCAGVGVVGANKRANSRSLEEWRQLQQAAFEHDAPYRYETTVGAAIPLLGPLRDLRLRGEPVRRLQGVLSGSLSYILHRLHAGAPFSEAAAEAVGLGYTEPDPGEDLRAVDLGRKLLVLAREAGFPVEPRHLHIEPLSSTRRALASEDASWQRRISAVLDAGQRLVMLAEADASGARVTLQAVAAQSPFGTLLPGQNLVLIHTDLQHGTPLSLSGQGAGAELTAAGLLSDVLAAATQLARRH